MIISRATTPTLFSWRPSGSGLDVNKASVLAVSYTRVAPSIMAAYSMCPREPPNTLPVAGPPAVNRRVDQTRAAKTTVSTTKSAGSFVFPRFPSFSSHFTLHPSPFTDPRPSFALQLSAPDPRPSTNAQPKTATSPIETRLPLPHSSLHNGTIDITRVAQVAACRPWRHWEQ
jgi:hypothetical protein